MDKSYQEKNRECERERGNFAFHRLIFRTATDMDSRNYLFRWDQPLVAIGDSKQIPEYSKLRRCKSELGIAEFEFHIVCGGDLCQVFAGDVVIEIFHILTRL